MSHHTGSTVALVVKFKGQFRFMWRSRTNKRKDNFFVLFQAHNLLVADPFTFCEEYSFCTGFAIRAFDSAG